MPKKIIVAETNKYEYRKFIAVMVFIILAATLMSTLISFRWLDWIRWQAGATLLIFGGFKLISYDSYLSVIPRYDPMAARYSWYGLAYPVVEVLLGICFILDIAPSFRHVIALFMVVVGLFSMVSNLSHKGPSTKNTWLGGLLKLPMTTAILFEDAYLTVLIVILMVGNIFVH